MGTYGYLMHYGVKGMRWGVRNYQNADGSYTAEGKIRYNRGNSNSSRIVKKDGKIDYHKTIDNNFDSFRKSNSNDSIRKEVIKFIKPDKDIGVSIHDIWDNTDKVVVNRFAKHLGLNKNENIKGLQDVIIGGSSDKMRKWKDGELTSHIEDYYIDRDIEVY